MSQHPSIPDRESEQGLDALYRDVILDHYRRPRNCGPLKGANFVASGHNPVCGDRITVYGKVDPQGRFELVSFEGKSCAICTASSSMMTQVLPGKSLSDADHLAQEFKSMMRSETAFEAPQELPDLEALEGVRKFPARIKCATLCWTTLHAGILGWKQEAS